jgi:integrase/recombinase XerD
MEEVNGWVGSGNPRRSGPGSSGLGQVGPRCGRRPRRLGCPRTTGHYWLLSPATVQRVLAATSSFFEWAIAAEQYTSDENPMQLRVDHALGRVPDRHQPFVGAASRQQPMRRTVRVRLPLRLPRPMSPEDVDTLLASVTTLRDLAIFLLMLDGGLRPGEVLCLQLADVSYGRRRVTIRKRDDHPRGARAKSRQERVVDLHEPRTLDALNRYVLHERPLETESSFVFLVGGSGPRRCDPLSYQALARGFARRLDRLGIRTPDKTPHALRHTHATAMWEGGMRELALQKRLGHASPDSIRIYTRVSDQQVLADYTQALTGRS